MSRHFSIDALTARHGRVFGWGWFLDTDSMSRGAELTLPLVGGGVATVACLEGATRPDVAAAFPGVPHAANTGFMVMAQLPSDVDPHAEARFVACLQNGERHEIALSMESLGCAPHSAACANSGCLQSHPASCVGLRRLHTPSPRG